MTTLKGMKYGVSIISGDQQCQWDKGTLEVGKRWQKFHHVLIEVHGEEGSIFVCKLNLQLAQ